MRVLMIGDSISMGYEGAVRRALAGAADASRGEGNGGDSDRVRAGVASWLDAAMPDAVTLNCGLHDIKRNRETGAYQVPIDRYRTNLAEITGRVLARGSMLVWVATTPVIESRHRRARDFDRFNGDIVEYNAAAMATLEGRAAGVIRLDAYALAMGLEESMMPDGVHFTEAGYERLGAALANALQNVLKR